MSLAFTWVQYNNNISWDSVNSVISSTIITNDLPFLSFGNYNYGQTTQPVVVGLRFIGCGAQNIKFWLDGTYNNPGSTVYADIWNYTSGNQYDWHPIPRVPLMGNVNTANDFIFYTLPLINQAAVNNLTNTSSTWGNTLTAQPQSFNVPDCDTLQPNGEVYSAPIAITATIPSALADQFANLSHCNIRNFRLMCSFDTNDGYGFGL